MWGWRSGYGTIVGVGAVLATRWLERYKTREAARLEAAKTTFDRLGKLWSALLDVEMAAHDLFWLGVNIRIDERRKLSTEEFERLGKIPTVQPVNAEDEWPQDPDLEAVARPRFEQEVLPKVRALEGRVYALISGIESERFWIGDHFVTRLEQRRGLVRNLVAGLAQFTLNDFRKANWHSRETARTPFRGSLPQVTGHCFENQ